METRVNVEEGKKYLYVQTTENGIRQFKVAAAETKVGVEISNLKVINLD